MPSAFTIPRKTGREGIVREFSILDRRPLLTLELLLKSARVRFLLERSVRIFLATLGSNSESIINGDFPVVNFPFYLQSSNLIVFCLCERIVTSSHQHNRMFSWIGETWTRINSVLIKIDMYLNHFHFNLLHHYYNLLALGNNESVLNKRAFLLIWRLESHEILSAHCAIVIVLFLLLSEKEKSRRAL